MQINSIYLTPILEALNKSTKTIDNNSYTPSATLGTVQQNFGSSSGVSLYNAHGIVTPSTPNTLIAYA
jgi:hypothetical protein